MNGESERPREGPAIEVRVRSVECSPRIKIVDAGVFPEAVAVRKVEPFVVPSPVAAAISIKPPRVKRGVFPKDRRVRTREFASLKLPDRAGVRPRLSMLPRKMGVREIAMASSSVAVHAIPATFPCETFPNNLPDYMPLTRPAVDLKRISYLKLTDLCTEMAKLYGLPYSDVKLEYYFHHVPEHLASSARIDRRNDKLQFHWERPSGRETHFCSVYYGLSRTTGRRLILIKPLHF